MSQALGPGIEGTKLGLRSAALERYWLDVRKYFARRVTPAMDVDDLVQEVCLRFLVSNDLTCPPRPLPYLYGIASHVLTDYRKKQKRQRDMIVSDRELSDANLAADRAQVSTSEELGRAQLLDRFLSQLPAKHCAVLLAHERDGLSYQETATKLSLSVHTVEKYLTQAKAQLRRICRD